MVQELKHNSLISGDKFADANYITVLTRTEVLIYGGNDIHISVSKEEILRGWRDTTTGLWRVPLQPNVPPPKSELIFLEKSREEAIANAYEITLNIEKYTISTRMCRFPHQCNLARGHQ